MLVEVLVHICKRGSVFLYTGDHRGGSSGMYLVKIFKLRRYDFFISKLISSKKGLFVSVLMTKKD